MLTLLVKLVQNFKKKSVAFVAICYVRCLCDHSSFYWYYLQEAIYYF